LNWTLYASFLGVALLICLMPGPTAAYVIAVASRGSRREILLNVLGLSVGAIAIVIGLALGLAQLMQTSPAAYAAMKMVGCAYLVWLGIQALRPKGPRPADAPGTRSRWTDCGPMLQGFLVEATNPKAWVSYAALIPQFVDAALGNVDRQIMVLGASLVAIALAYDLFLIAAVQRLRRWTGFGTSAASQQWGQRIYGVTMLGLGLLLLMQEGPRA
jgi:threonine/homoserine/homoserine lactone efflux protein